MFAVRGGVRSLLRRRGLITGLVLSAAACGGEPTAPSQPAASGPRAPEPPAPTTGSIIVGTITRGATVDGGANSYTILFGSKQVSTVGANASVLITGLTIGAYSVTLSNVPNCVVIGRNPRQLIVVAGRVTRTIFNILC